MPNGYGPRPGMQGGGGYQSTAAPGMPYGYPITTWEPTYPYVETQTPSQTYSGTSPAPWATDTPALIPQQPQVQFEPVWFDPLAPLDFSGLNFPDEPVSSPPITSTLPTYNYDWQAPLDFGGLTFPSAPYAYPPSYIPEPISEGIVFPFGPSTPELSAPAEFNWENPQWFDWQAPLEFEGLEFGVPSIPGIIEAPDIRTGPLESIGKFAGDVIKGIGDVAKFIVDHLDLSVRYAGDFGGVKTQKAYYSTTQAGAPAPVILGMPGGAAPSVKTSVTAGGPGGGPAMTEEERLYREALGQTQADSNKFIVYAAGAYLAYRVLLK